MRYVVIGYILTYGTLLAYVTWLGLRLRAARERPGGDT
jgi:hypothetical protein